MSKISPDTTGNTGSDFIDLHQFFFRSRCKTIDTAEGIGQFLGNRLSDKSNAKSKKYPFERNVSRKSNRFDNITGRLITQTFERRDIALLQLVKVGNISHHSQTEKEVYRLSTQTIDIHSTPTDKMLDTTLDLRGTRFIVGAIPCRFTFVTNQWCTAFGTMRDKMHLLPYQYTGIGIDPGNLGYDLSPFLHIDPISDMQVERLYDIVVMQRRPFYDRTR